MAISISRRLSKYSDQYFLEIIQVQRSVFQGDCLSTAIRLSRRLSEYGDQYF